MKLLFLFLYIFFALILSNGIYVIFSYYVNTHSNDSTMGLTLWLTSEFEEFRNDVLIFASQETLLKLYGSLALLSWIVSMSLYHITKNYNTKIPVISTTINYYIALYLLFTSFEVKVKKDLILFGMNLGSVAFNQDTATFLFSATILLSILLLFTPRSEKGVVLSLSCLLTQVINLLVVIRVTPLGDAGEGLFWGQVASLPTCFLVSLIGISGVLFITDKINKYRKKWSQVKFQVISSSFGLFFLLLSEKAKQIAYFILTQGEKTFGINIIN